MKEAKAVDDPEMIECAETAIELLQAEASAKKNAKEAQTELDTATLEKYGQLTEPDAQALVIDDKWQAMMRNRVEGEVNALTLDLVARIQQLGDRYADTVGELDVCLDEVRAKFDRHLAAMGVS